MKWVCKINELYIQWWLENRKKSILKNPSWKTRGVLFFCLGYLLERILPMPQVTHEMPSNPHIHHSKIWAVRDGLAGSWIQKYQGSTTAYRRKSPIAGIHQPNGVLPVTLSLLRRRISVAKIHPAMMHNTLIIINILIFLDFFDFVYVYKYYNKLHINVKYNKYRCIWN